MRKDFPNADFPGRNFSKKCLTRAKTKPLLQKQAEDVLPCGGKGRAKTPPFQQERRCFSAAKGM